TAKAHYAKLGAQAAAAEKEEQIKAKEKKRQQIIEMKEGLKQCIKDKEVVREARMKVETLLNEEDEAFKDMKNYVTIKKKEFEDNRAKNFRALQEKVAAVDVELKTEHLAKRQAFELAMELAHVGKDEKREAEEKAKRIAANADIAVYRQMKMKVAEDEREREWKESLGERHLFEEDFRAHEESERSIAMKRKNELKALQQSHMKQIIENKNRANQDYKDEMSVEKSIAETFDEDKQKFKAYAEQVITEFTRDGKDILPILRGLRQRNPFPPIPFETREDTFERLGFTMRYVPAFPEETDPWRRRTGKLKTRRESEIIAGSDGSIGTNVAMGRV
ncbi:hypothetical protein HDU76_009162, partial [Blyttiomyces sp. JEL0837]